MEYQKDGFFGNMFNLFKSNNDPYTMTPGLGMQYFNFKKQAQYISVDGKESEILRTTPQLFSVIYRRAQMLSNGIFVHLDQNGEPIENSELVKFLQRPNPFQTGAEWIKQLDVQKSTYGNHFSYILKGSELSEIPGAIWNLAPKNVIVERTGKIWQQTTEKAVVSGYKMKIVDPKGGQEYETFETREILHRNIQDVDDPVVGSSPFHALKMPISNIRGAYGFRNVIITEKGAIGMISNNSKSTAGALPLTSSERKNLEQQFSANYGINDRQRRIIMSSASLAWNPMSYPTKDMMLFEEVDENTRTIIDAYGLNEALFSLGKGTTFDNYREGEKTAYQDTIIPEGEDLAAGLTSKLGLEEKGQKLILDFSHVPVLQEDQEREANIIKTKADAMKVLIESGVYTAEEVAGIIEL